MSLTRNEAEQIAKEALDQGWEGDKHMVDLGDGQEYNEGRGSVEVWDWDEINKAREELGNGPWAGKDGVPWTGCSVELKFPDAIGLTYWISEREEWLKLKHNVDELGEIMRQVHERGWKIWPFGPKKSGRFGMYIEVTPRGHRGGPVRVGSMRTWRKLCREQDGIIEVRSPAGVIEAQVSER